MKKSKFIKRIISITISLALLTAFIPYNSVKANEFDKNYVNKEGMELGFSIINGYSKLSIKSNQYKDNNKIVVYCGLDVTNPYTLAVLGWYYLTKGIDLERILTDTDYDLKKIAEIETALKNAGIKNERAKKYKALILKGAGKIYKSFDTVGMYIFDSTDNRALELMKKDYVDFVIDGGQMPASLKDLNIDGKSDIKDAIIIQKYLAGTVKYTDPDENEYAKYVCDIDGDKTADIKDVTYLMKNS